MNGQVCQTHPRRGLERCHLAQFVVGRIFWVPVCVPALLARVQARQNHLKFKWPLILLVAGQGRGQDPMVIPVMWDTGGRVRAPPLSVHTILLLQHWPRAHKHPSSFPGEESHFLLIPVISCSLRQAPFGPKRELGKDFNLQTALFHWRDLSSWAPQT